MVAKILEGTLDWNMLPSATPWRLKQLLRRCLRKDPGRRLHDIADARSDIEEAFNQPLIPQTGTVGDMVQETSPKLGLSENILERADCAT